MSKGPLLGIVILLAASVLPNVAAARDLNWPGIIGKDDRVMADSTKPPWRSVGRFNYAGYREYGFCTGTLIAPSVVVTAAHCFFHPVSHARLASDKFRFALGLRRDEYLGLARIRCIRFHPDFNPNRKPGESRIDADVAIVILDEAMNEPPIELAGDDALAPDMIVTHAGYGRDRPYILSIHKDCRVFSSDGPIALTSCDTNYGQSGGPILIGKDGAPKLAAIMSGFSDKLATWVVGVSAWRGLIAGGDCMQ